MATAASAARVWGANERIRVGVLGAGGRGTLLAGVFKELGADVAAVCDVYEPHLQGGLQAASTGARGYDDYRAVLEDKSLDAVIIATPDHWHARMAIDAVAAGKDIYLEKPMAHTVDEGFQVIEAVRAHKRVAQVGTQRRSSELFQEAHKVMQSGAVGPVRVVTSWWMNHQNGLNPAGFAGKINWDRWIGPASKRPQDAARFFNWYYFWDYSGGMMIGQGAHMIDEVQWYLGATWPSAANASALGPNLPGAEVPETTSMSLEFPEGALVVFTVGYKAMRYNMHNDQIAQFHGAKARFDVEREAYTLYPASSSIELKPSVAVRKPNSFGPATLAHVRNFLECVRSRKEPNATVEMGQYTNVALCIAAESLRTGRRVRYNSAARKMEA